MWDVTCFRMLTVQRFTKPISCYSIGTIKKQSLRCVSAGWRNERGKNQYDRVRSNNYCNLARMEPITQICYPAIKFIEFKMNRLDWGYTVAGLALCSAEDKLRRTYVSSRGRELCKELVLAGGMLLLLLCCNPSKLYDKQLLVTTNPVYHCWSVSVLTAHHLRRGECRLISRILRYHLDIIGQGKRMRQVYRVNVHLKRRAFQPCLTLSPAVELKTELLHHLHKTIYYWRDKKTY